MTTSKATSVIVRVIIWGVVGYFLGLLIGHIALPAEAKETKLMKSIVTIHPTRSVYITDVIDENILPKATRLLKLSKDSKEPIDILIESPGGSVAPGMIFLQAMEIAKNRGATLRCIVPGFAASMAFVFLAHCEERYVLPNAMLLFHPMAISGIEGRVTKKILANLIHQFEILNYGMDEKLVEIMAVDKEFYDFHNEAETLWTAKALHVYAPDFLTLVEDIKGEDSLFSLENSRNNRHFRYILDYIRKINVLELGVGGR